MIGLLIQNIFTVNVAPEVPHVHHEPVAHVKAEPVVECHEEPEEKCTLVPRQECRTEVSIVRKPRKVLMKLLTRIVIDISKKLLLGRY